MTLLKSRDGSKGGKYGSRLEVRMKSDEIDEIRKYAERNNISVSETVRRGMRLFFYQMEVRKDSKK